MTSWARPGLAKVRLSPTLTLSPSWFGALDRRLCSFFFWQGRLRRSCQLLSLWHWGHSFVFGRPSMLKFFRWSLRHSARLLLVSAAPTSLPFLFSFPIIWLSFCSRHPVLSLIFPLISNSVADLAGTVFSLLFYQATMGPRTLISTGKRRGWWAGQTGSAICALRNPLYSLSSYISYPFSSYLGLEAYCLIEILWHTGSLDFHRGTCASSSCSLCPLSFTLQPTQPSFWFLSL